MNDAPYAPSTPPARGVWIAGHDRRNRPAVEAIFKGLPRPPSGPLDRAVILPVSIDEALYFAGKAASRLVPGGELWIVISTSPDHADPFSTPSLAPMLLPLGFRCADSQPPAEKGFHVIRFVLPDAPDAEPTA